MAEAIPKNIEPKRDAASQNFSMQFLYDLKFKFEIVHDNRSYETSGARGIPLFLPLSSSFFARTRERIERTMESQVSFYSRKRYRLRAFTVRTRKIDRGEEVVGEHKTHLPSFFINVFTTVSSSSTYPTKSLPFPKNRSIAKRFNQLREERRRVVVPFFKDLEKNSFSVLLLRLFLIRNSRR